MRSYIEPLIKKHTSTELERAMDLGTEDFKSWVALHYNKTSDNEQGSNIITVEV